MEPGVPTSTIAASVDLLLESTESPGVPTVGVNAIVAVFTVSPAASAATSTVRLICFAAP